MPCPAIKRAHLNGFSVFDSDKVTVTATSDSDGCERAAQFLTVASARVDRRGEQPVLPSSLSPASQPLST
jgi:hypothetical protein